MTSISDKEAQLRLAREVQIPKSVQPFNANELIFSIDVHYVGDQAYVAVDITNFSQTFSKTIVRKFKSTEEYVSGFFANKEGPLVLKGVDYAKSKGFEPSLVIVDGHGTAHPRKFGLACWVGLKLQIPTIGVAKRPLVENDLTVSEAGGSTVAVTDANTLIGYVLRTKVGVKPVYVSAGNLISQAQAVEVVYSLRSKYRIIEPIRRADAAARSMKVTE